MDQPSKVANPARGQLNRENDIPLSPCVPENLVSRDGFSRPVPRQPAHLHTQAESGAYLRDSSRVPRRRPFMKPPYAIGSVPSLSGHAIAYRWRSLPRVRRHRASKPQGSSERVLPWQITMDQLIFASLSHTHYWYEVGMLKVPAYGNEKLIRKWTKSVFFIRDQKFGQSQTYGNGFVSAWFRQARFRCVQVFLETSLSLSMRRRYNNKIAE